MPDFFVIHEYSPGKWAHVYNTGTNSPLFPADDAADACGLAAIQQGESGKYAAADETNITAEQVQVQPSADTTNVPFP